MFINPNAWCLVTTHKENYSIFPAFMSYYRQYFGFRRALIFCGRPPSRTHQSLKELLASKLKVAAPLTDKTYKTAANLELTVSELVDGDFTLWIASYPEGDLPGEELQKILWDLAAWGEQFLPKEISRTLVLDADEFLYVKNPQTIENLDSLGFHFLDMIPSPVWPPEKLNFSLQGWYYRRQDWPKFKYGGRLAVWLATITGRGLIHDCKTYYFDRKRFGNWASWRHGTKDSLCCCGTLNSVLPNVKECHEILRNTACCYHLAMRCKEHFLNERARLFSRLQVNLNNTSDQDLKPAEKAFDKLRESIFPVVEDNFLLPYLLDCTGYKK